MRYRPVVGWGRLPDTWSFVEATSVAVDGRDNVYVFIAPHGCAVDSRGDLYVAEVSWTARASKESPPREIRSLQKFERV